MADPLRISTSLLGSAIQAANSLCDTIKRFKDRNKTLRRLQNELEDLTNILDSLTQIVNAESSVWELLHGPINRCRLVCGDFEECMKEFAGQSKVSLKDWAKMEFMRGDINEFIDTLVGYKSTISVGLGTISLRTSKVSQEVLQQYYEMIQDTAYNLELHMQRIDEKMTQYTIENASVSDAHIDLSDEKAVTKQCLRVCEDARSYIESLTNRESPLLQETSQTIVGEEDAAPFEAQRLTREALDGNRESFTQVISHLRGRLELVALGGDDVPDNERRQLQEDIETSKQCLELCRLASELSQQKIYRVGEAVAEGDSDQVVVNTLADLFDVKKALSKDHSAQLLGSMEKDALMYTIERRYDSRFGAVAGATGASRPGTAAASPSASEARKTKSPFQQQMGNEEPSTRSGGQRSRAYPNEMRKRMVDIHDPRSTPMSE